MDSTAFEALARRAMSLELGIELLPGEVGGVPKRFDLVGGDGAVVGDAKFYTLVRGSGLPPAKFATIAEYVWLLEKTGAAKRFLVFGNERRVPVEWLVRYGKLRDNVDFYFLTEDGTLERLG